MKEHPVRGLQVIGQEVYWEGELVLFINPNLGASVDTFVRESLDGLALTDWNNKGDRERAEDAEGEVEELKEKRQTLADLLRLWRKRWFVEKRHLAMDRDRLREAANAEIAKLTRERDEARAFAEKVLKDHTAWIAWARSMGYIQ